MKMKGLFNNILSKKLWNKKTIFTAGLAIVSSIIFLSIGRRFSFNLTHQRSASVFRYPLCKEGVLSKGAPLYQQDHLPLLNQNDVCRLHFYNQADLVTCFDALNGSDEQDSYHKRRNNTTLKNIHIAFVGDSRIRQMFGNVIQLLPFFEEKTESPQIDYDKSNRKIQYNLHLEATLLKATLSFHWVSLMDDTFFEMINSWIADDGEGTPSYLVIGNAFHHIRASAHNGTSTGFTHSHKTYEQNVIRLWPLLDELNRKHGVRVVWWSQDIASHPPINNQKIMFFFGMEKILGYNHIARRIFELSKAPLEIWDSTNKVYMEYLRKCELEFKRNSPQSNTRNGGLFVNSWSRCYEVNHASQSHTLISAQLVLNDLCNKVIEEDIKRR